MSCFILDKKERKKLYFQQYYKLHREEFIKRSTERSKQNRTENRSKKLLYQKQYYKRIKQKKLDERVNYFDDRDLIFSEYFTYRFSLNGKFL